MDINFRVAAFDPGGTTGWSTFSALWVPGLPFQQIKWDCGHLGPGNHHDALEQHLGIQRVQFYTVVAERFTDRVSEHSVVLDAKEYEGVIKRYCEAEGVELHLQMPAIAKGFTKNENLKRLGLWEGTKWKHAMDARRHLLWFLINSFPTVRQQFGRAAVELRSELLTKGWPNQ